MRLTEEDITRDTLHAMIDTVDPMFFGRAGNAAEHAWVNEQMAKGTDLREIRAILTLRLQYADGLADDAEPVVLVLPKKGATRNRWFARNGIAFAATCSMCQIAVNALDIRTEIVKLPCTHIVCKVCCIGDFASYRAKTTIIPGEANDADVAVKAALESGELDPADLEADDLARILGGDEEVALTLHAAHQYQCAECHAVYGKRTRKIV